MIPVGHIEEVYQRISTMHHDYEIYWKNQMKIEGSQGMIAHYGEEQTGNTNRVSNPTENKAMPELNMSDTQIYRRSWVACILFLIDRYDSIRGKDRAVLELKSRVLNMRAIEGKTLDKICEQLNEGIEWAKQININRVRNLMRDIVTDIASEAERRGLFRDQK